MATFLVRGLHFAQASLGAYGLYVSYISITNLRQYEEQTKKAAKYLNTAEHQLHKTRTTQASGALSILTSFVLSTCFTVFGYDSLSSQIKLINVAMIALTFAARTHMSNFWKGSAKVPLMDGYNEAISKTGEMMQCLTWLQLSWVGTSAVVGLAWLSGMA